MKAPAILASSLTAAVKLQTRANASAYLVASLTERQRDVLQGMVDGLLNKQIAIRLNINEKTVKMHRAALLERLRVPTSAAAVRVGVEAEFAEVLWSEAPRGPKLDQQVVLFRRFS